MLTLIQIKSNSISSIPIRFSHWNFARFYSMRKRRMLILKMVRIMLMRMKVLKEGCVWPRIRLWRVGFFIVGRVRIGGGVV